MIGPLQRYYDALEDGRTKMLAEVQGLTAEQRAFKAEPDAWSPLMVAHHVLLAEQRSVGAMLRLQGKPSARRSFRDRVGYAAVWLVLTTGLRARLRDQPAPPDAGVSLDEIESGWQEVRERLRGFLADLPEAGLTQAGMKHPVAGPLNVREGLLFLVRHLRHHLRQIERTRRHPAFPRPVLA
jgi:hypothetical protein